MSGINHVTLLGTLAADPTLKDVSGRSLATLDLVTTDSWRDRDGARKERTDRHAVVVWGKQAEHCAQQLAAGSTVAVVGRLQSRDWKDKTGAARTTVEVNATTVVFLDGPGSSRPAPQPAPDRDPPAPPPSSAARPVRGSGRFPPLSGTTPAGDPDAEA